MDGSDGGWKRWRPGAVPRFGHGGADPLGRAAGLLNDARAKALCPVQSAVYPEVPAADSVRVNAHLDLARRNSLQVQFRLPGAGPVAPPLIFTYYSGQVSGANAFGNWYLSFDRRIGGTG